MHHILKVILIVRKTFKNQRKLTSFSTHIAFAGVQLVGAKRENVGAKKGRTGLMRQFSLCALTN